MIPLTPKALAEGHPDENAFARWWGSEDCRRYVGQQGFHDSRPYNVAQAAFHEGYRQAQVEVTVLRARVAVLEETANQKEWCVMQRTDGSAFSIGVTSLLKSTETSSGERIVAVTYHETDAQAVATALSDRLRLDDAEARVAVLEKATEPFAEIYGEDDDDFPDHTKVTVQFGRTTHYALTAGDLRRARAALTPDAETREAGQ